MKIPNRILQSLLNFTLPYERLEVIKEKMESTRHREAATIKDVKPIAFYEPLTQPCYYQHQNTSKILSSDGNRIICYEINILNICLFKNPVFISLDKKSLTEEWMSSVGGNRTSLNLENIILAGKVLEDGNIFETAVNDQLMDIKKLVADDDAIEVNALYLLDALNAAIAASEDEIPTVRISTEGGKTVLFQGGKVIGVIMGIS